ncbi:PREDICTED: uncharacterized protein LOC105564599 isoform X1 [Vollenhovia emeryi]|uniref:uncharacterized protein LOC105564599 isoform X1 n=1 Tax=Vollenhovia emeryi TaxID=411798 RepID=UPI0005F465EA|nr:PREDICTED: uncharacterized protein LOC105564599 isoform X1 [Vollenhovia emeryi]
MRRTCASVICRKPPLVVRRSFRETLNSVPVMVIFHNVIKMTWIKRRCGRSCIDTSKPPAIPALLQEGSRNQDGGSDMSYEWRVSRVRPAVYMLYECDVPADDRDVLRGGAGLGKGIVRRRSILGVSSCCYLLGGNYLAKC